MADSFQPKFADLVRNYTTTAGTDDFVLGSAVNGYSDLARTLQEGDSFYYSALGVDTPAETEVGRGTLLKGGVIARDPVGGVRTDFSAGTKSIALIAAAEWFTNVEAGSAAVAPTRAALAAQPALQAPGVLAESMRGGLFLFDSADLSTFVAADSAQGIYVAPDADPTGASGAWVRKFDGHVNAGWFGLVNGDDPANAAANTAAFSAMLAVLEARRDPYPASVQNCIERILIPYGVYWFGDAGAGAAMELTSAVILEGHSVGCGEAAPILKFLPGVTGIRVQDGVTSGATTLDTQIHNGAQGTIIRNLALEGSFTGLEAEAHGVMARTLVHCEHVLANNFEGDGFHIAVSTDAPSGANPPYGNANISAFINCSSNGNRNGIYFAGSDANASTIINFNANSNRQAGIYDTSFLGNSYYGGQFASNGTTPYNDGVNVPVSVVSFNGNMYGCIAGQEVGGSTNAPSGTTAANDWWYYVGAGGPYPGIPQWTSGLLLRAGGPIIDDQPTSTNVFSGVYAENSGAMAQIAQRSIVVGGMLSYWIFNNPAVNRGTAVVRGGNNGGVETDTCFIANSGTVTAKLGTASGNPNTVVLNSVESTFAPSGHQLRYASLTGGALLLTYANSASANNYAFSVSTLTTTETFGTGVVQPHTLYAPRLAVGSLNGGTATARRIFVDSAMPSTGDHGQGEFVFARSATAGLVGWRCRTAGSPGTWEEVWSGFGTAKIGYATGAGGAIAQATSKSTAVTINKLCGQITANSGALSPGAITKFTVNNNQVAATDTIILNLAGGATDSTAYRCSIGGVSTGSFAVSLENASGSTLSEPLVLNFAVVKAVAA